MHVFQTAQNSFADEISRFPSSKSKYDEDVSSMKLFLSFLEDLLDEQADPGCDPAQLGMLPPRRDLLSCRFFCGRKEGGKEKGEGGRRRKEIWGQRGLSKKVI